MNEPRLTHLDESGRARMVDVSNKRSTRRIAVAAGEIRMRPETLALVRGHDISKGDVLGVARIAGVMAAKQAANLIPLCHPLPIDDVAVAVTLREDRALIEASVVTVARTGAEMEALVAVSVAAMTIYDMCKGVDREMVVENVRLVFKTGGKSDFQEPGYAPLHPMRDSKV